MGKFGGRGKIPETFSPGDGIDLPWKNNEFAKQYRLWILTQYKDNSPIDNEPHIPSFAAVKSLLDSSTFFITKSAFASILPYPATEYNAIFTTMINFHDVMKQKERENGPFWSDEGVYHTAKEIQLLYPQKCSYIYPLGMVASIKKRQSLVVWVCTSNQVVSKICQSKKRFMDLQLATQL